MLKKRKIATLHSCKGGEQFLKLDNLVGVKWTEGKFSCYQQYFSCLVSAILSSFFAVLTWTLLYLCWWASVMAQQVKYPPVMQETQETVFDPWVRKIPWSGKMTTHSSSLAWKIAWTEEPGRLHSMGSQRVRHAWLTQHKHTAQYLLWIIAKTF